MTNEPNGTPRDDNAATPGGPTWNSSPQGSGTGATPYGQEPSGYPQPGYGQPGYSQPGYDPTTQGQGYGTQGYPTQGYGAPAASDAQGHGGQPYGNPGYAGQSAPDPYAQGYAAPQQPYSPSAYGAPFGAPAGGYLPGYGTPTLTPASWGRRLQGWLVDWLLGEIVLGILSALIFHPFRTTYNSDGTVQTHYSSTTLPGLVSFLILAVVLGLLTRNGQAPGHRWAKTQIVDEMGRPVSGSKAIIRNIAHYVDNLICGIGWLFPLWDAKRQTLADKIMKTTVVDVSKTGPIV